MRRMGVIERTGELLALEEALGACHDGTGGTVVIESAAAMGKTTLLQAFADRAVRSGAAFLGVAASHAERHLPLSAIGQLFRAAALPADEVERAERLLTDGSLTAVPPGPDCEPGGIAQVPAPTLARLGEILLGAAERGPLVIGVDDVHHADPLSSQFLAHLSGRLRSARVLLVLTRTSRAGTGHSGERTSPLTSLPARRIRLEPLDVEGVTGMLSRRFDLATARRLAPDCHQASGGNPLLVTALMEDFHTSRPLRPVCLILGEAFRQGVLACLYRCEPAALAVARGLAVFGGPASPAALGTLLGIDPAAVGPALDTLDRAGLLDGGGLRHDAVRTAVLDGVPAVERSALRLRAAEIMRDRGAPPQVLAEHLLAADRADAPWAVPALQEAAAQAMAAGEASRAAGYLRLALRACADDDRRPAVRFALAGAERQIDPATAARHLSDLARDLRAGRLPAENGSTLAAWMLWHGRVDEALETMAEASRRARLEGTREAGALEMPRRWLRYAYPGLAWDIGEDSPAPPDATLAAHLSPYVKVGTLLAGTLANGATDASLTSAEHLLRESGPVLRTLTPMAAMATLVYSDELDKAARWFEFYDPSAAQWPPLGTALLTALRASFHLRQGDLVAAERCAREALTVLAPKGWGVVVGIPLAVMLLSLTAMGRYEEVENRLDTPVPDAMFHTPHVLPYLQARGHYYLAINRPRAALAEFRACGELMTRWGFDAPCFVPWRTDAAQASLALGDRGTARRLAADQLDRLTPRQARTRGITLRTLAAASEPEERAAPLSTAVDLLEESGDRLELARALSDLSEIHRAMDRVRPAAALARRARMLAADCGADDVRDALSPRVVGDKGRGEAGDGGRSPAELSDAEWRVASLAAGGHSNRQIARRLHVTVSTVEQHLTRVYRKLKVSRRTDLPLELHAPGRGRSA
jgi:DNA-binding CsgD family transcriptional regulator